MNLAYPILKFDVMTGVSSQQAAKSALRAGKIRVYSLWVEYLEARFDFIGVAASVSEWFVVHSLTLAATKVGECGANFPARSAVLAAYRSPNVRFHAGV